MDITEIRGKIDQIDNDILKLLAKRFSLLPDILRYKQDNNLPIQDLVREKEVIKKKIEQAFALGINSDFTRELFEIIMCESRRIQNEKK